MSRPRSKALAGAALCCLALILSQGRLAAQAAVEPEKVKIQTVDGVDLRGLFYRGPKASVPTILVLHALGEHSQVQGWKQLAATLSANYSVMLFDFRGHGESKNVQADLFWKFDRNAQFAGKKVHINKDTIDFKNFSKSYYPTLVNDIATVKGWLDRKSDRGQCNTSSFIIIGGETGATLGAIWLTAEFSRFKVTNGPFGTVVENRAEGKDVIAAVFLSIQSKLGDRDVDLPKVLEVPASNDAVPVLFMFGDADVKGRTLAQTLEKKIKVKNNPRYKYSGAFAIRGNVNLKGVNLLEQKTLKTGDRIAEWLESVVNDKSNEIAEHDFTKSQYIWRIANGGPGPMSWVIKLPNEQNLLFDPYDKFIPSR